MLPLLHTHFCTEISSPCFFPHGLSPRTTSAHRLPCSLCVTPTASARAKRLLARRVHPHLLSCEARRHPCLLSERSDRALHYTNPVLTHPSSQACPSLSAGPRRNRVQPGRPASEGVVDKQKRATRLFSSFQISFLTSRTLTDPRPPLPSSLDMLLTRVVLLVSLAARVRGIRRLSFLGAGLERRLLAAIVVAKVSASASCEEERGRVSACTNPLSGRPVASVSILFVVLPRACRLSSFQTRQREEDEGGGVVGIVLPLLSLSSSLVCTPIACGTRSS